MKQISILLSTIFFLLLSADLYSQTYTVSINVNDGSAGLPGANVTLDGTTLQTDASGNATFAGIADGTYLYTVTLSCYLDGSDSVVVAGSNVSDTTTLSADTANNVFFFITEAGGPPTASLGTTVTLFDANNSFSFVSSDPFGGEMIADVPYGTYSYSISKPCFQTDTGSVVVDCNMGMGISVFSNIAPDTANNVFFFITEAGGPPTASLGTTVTLFDANNSFSFVSSDPFGGEMIADVPYGTYSYSISKPCFQTDTGSVVVDCNMGMGISVFSNIAPDTANNVFFFITEAGGPPTASLGTTVTLFDANNSFSFVSSDPFGGEMIADVPYGTYSYSISKPCFQTDTGSVVVDCNMGMGISVFSNIAPDTANNVFFFITEAGGPPTASLGTTVTLFDANNSFSFVSSDPFGGEMIADVPYGTYSYSISKPCFQTDTGSVVVDCNMGMGISVFSNIAPDTANNVFFFITEAGGPPTASLGTTVTLFDANNSFSFVSSDPFGGEMIADVPYGTYSYSISKPCFQTDTGSVVVDCNMGMGISVFSNIAPDTANNVFFFITEAGGPPTASLGTTVTLFDANSSFSFVSSDPFGGEMIADVPYGTYSYSISKPCFQTDTGSVVVDCNMGMGISVFSNIAPDTANNVFFFITEAGGPPTASLGTTVTLFDANNSFSFVSSDPFGGEMIADVPYGTYSYSISKPCFQTDTGSVVVDCNMGMGISVFSNLMNQTVLTGVSQEGATLVVDSVSPEATYQWIDCEGDTLIPGATASSFTPSENGTYAVIITENSCSDTSDCVVVNTVGIDKGFFFDISVFPNPVNEQLTIDMGENTAQVRVQMLGVQGQILYDARHQAEVPIRLETAHLPTGIYLIRIHTETSSFRTQILKQ